MLQVAPQCLMLPASHELSFARNAQPENPRKLRIAGAGLRELLLVFESRPTPLGCSRFVALRLSLPVMRLDVLL